MEFFYAFVMALKDLKRKDLQKITIINGIVWSVVWIVLGVLSWDFIKGFMAFIINILPFKFVQHAGADFILMILWIQLVLITIGVFFSLFNQILSKKFFSILISLIIAGFWFVVFFKFDNQILEYLQRLIRIFPFETIEDAVASVLAVFVLYSFYIASIYLSFLFLAGRMVEKIREEEYPGVEINKNFSFFKLLFIMIRDLFIFVILLLILNPLLFVPFVNLIVVLILWSFLIKESLYQTIEMLFNIKVDNKKLWLFSIASVVFNFIPVANIYAPAFGEMLIFRYVFEQKIEKS